MQFTSRPTDQQAIVRIQKLCHSNMPYGLRPIAAHYVAQTLHLIQEPLHALSPTPY